MRRQEILNAARSVFARKGFNEAKLEDVAELAEFGKGTLYNYFPNKDALFASVLQDSFDIVKSIAVEALNADVPFTEKIERFVRGELSYFFRNPQSMQLMMRESHYLKGNNPMMQLLPQLVAMLAETIAVEQQRKKVITHAEPVELATILLNLVFGQFSARIYLNIIRQSDGSLNGANGTNGTQHPLFSQEGCRIAELFEQMTDEVIEREIEAATRLIDTVYFNGITT